MPDRLSPLQRLGRLMRRRLYRHVILPVINADMRRLGIQFYRYLPEEDLLVGHAALRWRPFDGYGRRARKPTRWYRALKDRGIDTDVIFDVGGGHGATSVWFAGWAQRVVLFEPHPLNRTFIRRHHAIRRVQNVELIAAAVSDRSGVAELHEREYAGHHALSAVGASEAIGTISVPTVRLDDFAAERGIDHIGVLKIDVEGFEPEVLRGAAGLLDAKAIDLVVFEYSPAFYLARDVDPTSPIKQLEAHGYRVFDVDGAPVDPVVAAAGRQTDFLAEPV